jgi:CheY-like chemotaxis protein
LIINASHAMPEGGIIKITAENVDIERDNPFSMLPGRYVKVLVMDHGIGIPDENLSKIFDPFFSTKKKGTGLGLSTSYSIIKNHGGYIHAESKLGLGTKMIVYLPATDKDALTVEKETEELYFGSGRILIMDDEEAVRKVAGRALSQLGYEIEFAAEGEDAIVRYMKALKAGKPFNLVIVDLTVPGGMDGKTAVQELQKYDPKIKAIVSSGYSNDPVMANFREFHFQACVSKPYQIKELGKIVHEVLSGNND